MPAESELSDAQVQAVARISAGPRGAIIGPFVPLLRSPELMTRVQLVGEYLRFESALEEHHLEAAILQIARHWDQQFEWGFHVPLALKAGVPQSVVHAIDRGEPLTETGDIMTVVTVARELLAVGQLTHETYQRAQALLGDVVLVELLVTVGYYTTLALVMNAAHTPPPPEAPRLSARSDRRS